MADIFSPSKRSMVMSHIRGRGNLTTELRLAKLLRRSGIKGWRRHAHLPGTPDFCFPKSHICVFVHGCFWHSCPHCGKRSKTRARYWNDKLRQNRARDIRVARKLRALGYRVITIWECRLRTTSNATTQIRKLARFLHFPPTMLPAGYKGWSGISPASR